MYHYRLANGGDLPWLDRAMLAAVLDYPQEGQRAGLGPADMARRGQQRLRSALSNQGGAILALAGQAPAGFSLFAAGMDGATDEVQGYLLDLWVAPEHRRRGIGTTLLGLTEGVLAGRDVRKMKIVLPVDRQAGLALATRRGFRPEGLLALKNLWQPAKNGR